MTVSHSTIYRQTLREISSRKQETTHNRSPRSAKYPCNLRPVNVHQCSRDVETGRLAILAYALRSDRAHMGCR